MSLQRERSLYLQRPFSNTLPALYDGAPVLSTHVPPSSYRTFAVSYLKRKAMVSWSVALVARGERSSHLFSRNSHELHNGLLVHFEQHSPRSGTWSYWFPRSTSLSKVTPFFAQQECLEHTH